MSKKRALGFKQLECKECGTTCDKVDLAAESITCSRCVQKGLNGGLSMTEEEYWEAVKSGKMFTQNCQDSE
jgi:hypothetical protein